MTPEQPYPRLRIIFANPSINLVKQQQPLQGGPRGCQAQSRTQSRRLPASETAVSSSNAALHENLICSKKWYLIKNLFQNQCRS